MSDVQRPDERHDPGPGQPPAGRYVPAAGAPPAGPYAAPPGPPTGRSGPPHGLPMPPTGHTAPPPGPPPPGPPIPPYPPAPRRRSGWKVVGIVAAVLLGIPIILLIVGLIAVAVRDDSPSSSSPPARSPLGSSTVLDVRPGECFDSAPVPTDGSTTSVLSVAKKPCTEPHTQQAVETVTYVGTWSSVQNTAEQACRTAFTDKVPTNVLSDGRHVPAIMHADRTSSTFVVCVIASDQPATGTALK